MKKYPLNVVDRYEDFTTFIESIGNKYGDAGALCEYNGTGALRTASYAELAADVFALAEALISRRETEADEAAGDRSHNTDGNRHNTAGDRRRHIAVVGEASCDYVKTVLGIIVSGAVSVNIDIEQSVDVIVSMILRADADAVFASPSVYSLLAERRELDGAELYSLDDARERTSFGSLLAEGRALVADGGSRAVSAPRDPDATALIIYTSGTTSTAKPVMLPHRAVLTNACESVALVRIPSPIFTSLPLYHIYGFTCAVLNNLVCGSLVCINGNIKHMTRDLASFRPATVMAVPLIAELLSRQLMSAAGGLLAEKHTGFITRLFKKDEVANEMHAVKERVLPGLQLVICGGAHLPLATSQAISRFGVTVLQGYGITECSPLVTVNRNDYNDPATVGVPLPSCELKIVDDEVWVRGPTVMSGYYNDPELTAESITDGWYRTGDLGSINQRGFLLLTGRKKNIIVLKNGKKVSPEELESYICEIPAVAEAMVYGSASGTETDDVVPAVTIFPDRQHTQGLSSYEILELLQGEIDRLNEKLPSFKQIRIVNIREREFPKTATKKIKRGEDRN